MKSLRSHIITEVLTPYLDSRIITEGGACGHMKHLFDDPDLTFTEIKSIISDVFAGKIKVYEKADGQALSVTVIDGVVRAARNKTTLKNPMTIEELDIKFKDNSPEVHDAFVNCMAAIKKALEALSREEQNEIFANGKNYLAMEIIDPTTRNVVYYGDQLMIRLHGISVYDENWNLQSESKESSEEIFALFKKYGVEMVDNYRIKPSTALTIQDTVDTNDVVKELWDDIRKMCAKSGVSEDISLRDWAHAKYASVIKRKADSLDLELDDDYVELLVNNLCELGSNTKVTMTQIKKVLKERSWTLETHYNPFKDSAGSDFATMIEPLETIIIKAGVALLQRVSGFMSVSPDETSRKMASELKQCIDEFTARAAGDESKMAKLRKNIAKISKYQDKVMQAAEGVMFVYKDKLFKMTGQFGAINQILGLYKYDR